MDCRGIVVLYVIFAVNFSCRVGGSTPLAPFLFVLLLLIVIIIVIIRNFCAFAFCLIVT